MYSKKFRELLKHIFYGRRSLARYYSLKQIKNHDFTIISDNCWGRGVYKFLGLPCNTPTAGMGIDRDYLDFIENLNSESADEVTELDESHCETIAGRTYPIGRTPYAKLHFFRYNNYTVAQRLFRMRFKKINRENLYYKIDFDYYNCRNKEDIERWNKMQLPNSVAFYSDETLKFYSGKIHNGVYIKKKMHPLNNFHFGFNQKYFDFITWLNTGIPNQTLKYKVLNFILLDDGINIFIAKSLRSTFKKISPKILKRA
ncbi:DUF1919 domain-containing protein [Cyclobacterium sp. 1_MG-2023]|uniref:DUF1919 domain-containing protein n=1 Tax=Cyclobacterium sp. 1_MG-2023 TaxID=3062681 RepID=UPI0026E290D1|nr:DUF1919 domain-containing protein [Cyclobacterium sp. 1_MG-2023]MDO6437822.1 DUF1919 domain-containing protein [Cyclobacterium sp. 1_MG-2023]